MDTTTPLRFGVFIKNEDGSFRWLAFTYKHLFDFCFNCGKLGHAPPSCLSKFHPSYGARDPRHAFGPWMRASRSRHIPRWSPSTPHADALQQLCLPTGEGFPGTTNTSNTLDPKIYTSSTPHPNLDCPQ